MADGFFSKLKDKATDAAGVVADTARRGAEITGEKASAAAKAVADTSKSIASGATAQAGTLMAFLSTRELLKWSESVTESTASIYDKALDAEYLRTHIGGGDHRLFDGGHDLLSAWGRVRDASDSDTFAQEVIAYASATWKDVTTTKGIPFATVDKDSFGTWVDKLSSIPGVNREYLYDLLSFDVFEVLSTGLGAVGILLCLSKDDQRKLSEILGAMGITAIISANPLMGLMVVAVTGYSYFKKKKKLEGKALAKGAAVAGVSAGLFAVLGLPILVELVLVIVLTALLRKHLLDNEALFEMVSSQVQQVSGHVGNAWRRWRGKETKAAGLSLVWKNGVKDNDGPRLRRIRPRKRRRSGRTTARTSTIGRSRSKKRRRRGAPRPGRSGVRRPPRVRWAT